MRSVATDELLATVHDPDYVAAVKAASADPSARPTPPTAWAPRTTRPSRACTRRAPGSCTGTVDSCRAVWEGEAAHAVNFTGGLHHAMRGTASGFCVYNDIAVGIQWLLDHGAERVAYVDVDVHHGDGVERIFWDDPRVLTISVHETGRALFPGTGWPTDIGGPEAEGSAVNVALPPGLSDAGWLRAIHAVAMPVVRAFKPDVLVTQHGCDTHAEDPLAHFAVTVDAQRAAADALHRLAARGLRGPVGRARRRRLRGRRRRAAHVDAPDRHRRPRPDQDDRRRSPRTGAPTSSRCSAGPVRAGWVT